MNLLAAEAERGYGWLPQVVPPDAKRFRVADAQLAAALRDAGADVVDANPDVEIAPVRSFRGDAPLAIAVLGRPAVPGRPLVVRVVTRLVSSLWVRSATLVTRRAVRELGYAVIRTMLWDHDMPLQGQSRRHPLSRAGLVEHLPQRAVVVGGRTGTPRTILEAVLAEASRAVGVELEASPPSVRAELLIADTQYGILRLAVGPGRWQLLRQRAAIEMLRTGNPPTGLADRIPRIIASGKCGVADWSLESKLAGTRVDGPVAGRLLDDCVDFLVSLHLAGPSDARRNSLAEQAETVARACEPEHVGIVHSLASSLEAVLADVPRGFAHGDFFHGNLLANDDRLLGVVDWDTAGPARLPLVDLLHLRHATADFADIDWGPRFLERLLPWARQGGDDTLLAYCHRLGFSVDQSRLEAFAFAYWLDYVCSQLTSHPHRAVQSSWRDRNVAQVLDVVSRRTFRGFN